MLPYQLPPQHRTPPKPTGEKKKKIQTFRIIIKNHIKLDDFRSALMSSPREGACPT